MAKKLSEISQSMRYPLVKAAEIENVPVTLFGCRGPYPNSKRPEQEFIVVSLLINETAEMRNLMLTFYPGQRADILKAFTDNPAETIGPVVMHNIPLQGDQTMWMFLDEGEDPADLAGDDDPPF